MIHNWEWLLPGLLAIVLHELAHAWMAEMSGDPSPRIAGRMTLNPLAHVDPIGTIVMPLATLLATGVPMGWAKPVPVNFALMPGWKQIRVALAGPLCNLLQAGAWTLPFVIAAVFDVQEPGWLRHMCTAGILINAVLGVLNMLPVLPLDGARVLLVLLPPRWSRLMARYWWVQAGLLAVSLAVTAFYWRQ